MTKERKGLSKSSLKGLRTKQRMAVMREAQASASVSVLPANDDGRRLLKHPHSGGFPETGAALWPDDRFTKRRLADGSVTREAPPPEGGDARQRSQREQPRHRVEHHSTDDPKSAA
jgi:hypothetical protein